MSKSLRRPALETRIKVNLFIAIGYYILAELSRNLAATPNEVTPVWPPDGFAVGLTLIFGNMGLPGVGLGSFLANIGAFGEGQSFAALVASFLSVLGLALGTMLGTALCTRLLTRLTQRQYPFDRVIHTLAFFACAAVGPLANATFGVTMLALNRQVPWGSYGSVWLTWWISNVAGILIVTPALLSGQRWLQQHYSAVLPSPSLRTPWGKAAAQRWLEGTVVVGLLSWVAYLSFWGQQPLAYILVPLLVWVVFRFGQLCATLGVLWTAAIAIVGTVQGLGTFAQDELNQALVGLQCFIGVIGFTILILMAVLEERRSSAVRLRETVSELRQANQELAGYTAELNRAARLKDEFLSTISHELRTPLVGILGMAELLQQNQENPVNAEQLDAVQTIDRSGQHLLSLIDDILNFTNIEAGQFSLAKKRVEVKPVCQAVLEMMAPVAAKKGIELTADIPAQLRAIQLDEKRIQQVLINLLNNAVKYTPVEGRVALLVRQIEGCEAAPDKLRFSITDTGIGIPEAELDHVFDRFFQVDNQRRQMNEGLGLGLAIVKQLVDLHGGQIEVSSVVGEGSCFTVELPYGEAVGLVDLPMAPIQDHVSPYVLIAEDDRVSQRVLQRHLERNDYRVVIVPNGREAVDQARREVPALILMDIQMPLMDGFEAIEILRGDVRFRAVPIVVLTAFTRAEDRKRCFEVGATEYLTKPVKLDELLAVVQGHCPRVAMSGGR